MFMWRAMPARNLLIMFEWLANRRARRDVQTPTQAEPAPTGDEPRPALRTVAEAASTS